MKKRQKRVTKAKPRLVVTRETGVQIIETSFLGDDAGTLPLPDALTDEQVVAALKQHCEHGYHSDWICPVCSSPSDAA